MEEVPKRKSLIETLEEQYYAPFKLEYTDQEREALNQLQIEADYTAFDYFGAVDSSLEPYLQKKIATVGENTEEVRTVLANLFARVTAQTASDFKKEAVWATVRVSNPNHDFDQPRWHVDGQYFSPGASGGKAYKMVVTLKGPSTRFARVLDKEKFQRLLKNQSENYQGKNDFNEDVRIRTALAETIEEIYPVQEGQGVEYLVGDENAVVHSEPPFREPRVFMSVLPGSVEQINELKERWKK